MANGLPPRIRSNSIASAPSAASHSGPTRSPTPTSRHDDPPPPQRPVRNFRTPSSAGSVGYLTAWLHVLATLQGLARPTETQQGKHNRGSAGWAANDLPATPTRRGPASPAGSISSRLHTLRFRARTLPHSTSNPSRRPRRSANLHPVVEPDYAGEPDHAESPSDTQALTWTASVSVVTVVTW